METGFFSYLYYLRKRGRSGGTYLRGGCLFDIIIITRGGGHLFLVGAYRNVVTCSRKYGNHREKLCANNFW